MCSPSYRRSTPSNDSLTVPDSRAPVTPLRQETTAGETQGIEAGEQGRSNHKGRGRSKNVSVQDIITSGRRNTKRVDYRQLAEYGYGGDEVEGEEAERQVEQAQPNITPTTTTTPTTPTTPTTTTTTPLTVKKRRGRPRKHPLPPPASPIIEGDPNLPPDPVEESSKPPTPHTCPEDPTPVAPTPENNTGADGEEKEDGLDLLESCLKESGIKAVDAEAQGRKDADPPALKTPMEAQEDKEEEKKEEEEEGVGNEGGRVKLEDVDGFEDLSVKERSNVYVCDTLESVANVANKSNITSQYKCDQCGKMYSTLSILKSHRVRHRDKKDLPFHCDQCDFTAASKIELFRHSYKHTDAQLYICEICGNTFSRDTSLREHIEYVHTRTRRLKCAQCGYVTNRRQTMRKHLLSHKGVRPVIACPICGLTFRSKRNLKTHLYSHVGAKPFECDECDKKFILKTRLVVHKQQVHRPRTHQCQECDKSFPTYHHLQRHLRVHTGEKPYKCCFCSFSCNTQGNLIKHIRQIHEKQSFSYKDCLRIGRNVPYLEPLDDGEMKKMSEEGREVAQRLLPALEEYTGQSLSLDQLVQQVQKEKEAKAQSVQEQLSRKKKRATRKSSGANKSLSSSALCSGGETEGKVTLYAVSGGAGGSGTAMEPLIDDQVYIEDMANLGESQYLLTQPDDGGCVMIIPWDVSLMEEEEEAWGGERREVKSEDVLKVPKEEVTECIADFDSSLELDVRTKRIKEEVEEIGKVIEVRDLVGGLGSSIVGKDKLSDTTSADKDFQKRFPESIQVIASNEPVDDPSDCSSFCLPDGYIFDPASQVIHLPDGVLDANLLLRQSVRGGEAPEVTINKITSNVYSLMSQGSDGDSGETYVITTQDGLEDEVEVEEVCDARVEGGVARVDLQPGEEEEDRQSALVLIVNAEDLDS